MSSKSEMLSSTLILSSAKESIKTNVYSQRSLLIQPKTSLGKLPPTAASFQPGAALHPLELRQGRGPRGVRPAFGPADP